LKRLFDQGSEESARVSSIVAGFRMFVENPLTGVGWDCVAGLASRYGGAMDASAHNLLADGAAQGGIFGLGLALAIQFGVPFWLLRKSYRSTGYYVYCGVWIGLIICQTLVSTFMLEAHWDLFCFWIIYLRLIKSKSPRGITQISSKVC
jgi:O-antigen ligase